MNLFRRVRTLDESPCHVVTDESGVTHQEIITQIKGHSKEDFTSSFLHARVSVCQKLRVRGRWGGKALHP